eukprot:gene10151-11234_t
MLGSSSVIRNLWRSSAVVRGGVSPMMLRAMSSVAPSVASSVVVPPVNAGSEKVETAESHSVVSIVKHPYALQPGENSAPPSKTNDVFAVITLQGKQYKITQDDVIVSDKIDGMDIGDIVTAPSVLLLGSRNTTIIGRPSIAGARVTLEVEEVTKDKKVIAFKFRRRKSSRRLRGFRRQITILRVKEIDVGGSYKDDFVV